MKESRCSAPSVGGHELPAKYRRQDTDYLANVTVESELDKHIIRLLGLHPELRVKFRNQDLASLNDSTKKLLLEDMNKVLGIRQLRKTGK